MAAELGTLNEDNWDAEFDNGAYQKFVAIEENRKEAAKAKRQAVELQKKSNNSM